MPLNERQSMCECQLPNLPFRWEWLIVIGHQYGESPETLPVHALPMMVSPDPIQIWDNHITCKKHLILIDLCLIFKLEKWPHTCTSNWQGIHNSGIYIKIQIPNQTHCTHKCLDHDS